MEFFLSLSRDWITSSPFVVKVFAVVEKNRAMRVCTRTPRMVMVAMRVEGRFCLRTRARTYRSCAALSPSITTFFRTMALDISITDISFTLLSFEYEWERAERLHDRHRQTQKSVRGEQEANRGGWRSGESQGEGIGGKEQSGPSQGFGPKERVG